MPVPCSWGARVSGGWQAGWIALLDFRGCVVWDPVHFCKGGIFLCCARFFVCVYWEGSVRRFTAPVAWSGKSGRVSPSEMGVLRPVYNKPCLPDSNFWEKQNKPKQNQPTYQQTCLVLQTASGENLPPAPLGSPCHASVRKKMWDADEFVASQLDRRLW